MLYQTLFGGFGIRIIISVERFAQPLQGQRSFVQDSPHSVYLSCLFCDSTKSLFYSTLQTDVEICDFSKTSDNTNIKEPKLHSS